MEALKRLQGEVNALRAEDSGGNTMGMVKKFLDQQGQSDPRVAQGKRMIFGELEQTGRNLVKEAGIRPEEIPSGLGVHF